METYYIAKEDIRSHLKPEKIYADKGDKLIVISNEHAPVWIVRNTKTFKLFPIKKELLQCVKQQ